MKTIYGQCKQIFKKITNLEPNTYFEFGFKLGYAAKMAYNEGDNLSEKDILKYYNKLIITG